MGEIGCGKASLYTTLKNSQISLFSAATSAMLNQVIPHFRVGPNFVGNPPETSLSKWTVFRHTPITDASAYSIANLQAGPVLRSITTASCS